jgi:single-strand DNA-binding protein
MSSLQSKGKLHVKFDSQQVTDKFRKREFVVEIMEGSYPEYIKFQLVNDKCSLLDKYNVGDEMLISFNLKGKPFQSKTGETVYYTNLDVWKIDAASVGSSTAATTQTQQPTQMPEVPLPTDADDLPF